MKEEVDPIENTPEFRNVIKQVEAKIIAELQSRNIPTSPEFLGWCYIYWEAKKAILKRDYNISWKSPAEMNPNIHYD